MPDQLSVFPDRFPACGPRSVTFKVYGYKRSQLAFSSACDCCYGDRCVTMAIRRGSIKEEHSGSDSHKKRWSVLGFFCRVCVCVTVIPWGLNPTNFDFSIMVGPFFCIFLLPDESTKERRSLVFIQCLIETLKNVFIRCDLSNVSSRVKRIKLLLLLRSTRFIT